MSNVLGKRKRQVRRAHVSDIEEPQDENDREALQAALAKAFEARFKPLEVTKKNAVKETSPGESEDDDLDVAQEAIDDFEAFSTEDEERDERPSVEIVDYASSQQPDFMSLSGAKAFMVRSKTLLVDTFQANSSVGLELETSHNRRRLSKAKEIHKRRHTRRRGQERETKP